MNAVSPSASVTVPGVQVRVSATVAGDGPRVTVVSTGGLLSMVTLAVAAGPSP